MTKSSIDHLQLDLDFGSDIPTEPAPQRGAETVRAAAKTLNEESWFDSEAPTGVAAERPLLPRPPSLPRV